MTTDNIKFENSGEQTAQAFRQRQDVQCMVGHLSFLSLGKTPPIPLAPDLMLWNPVLDTRIPAVGAIEKIEWGGNAWDKLTMTAWVSANNRLIISTWLHGIAGWQISMDKTVAYLFDVYQYDPLGLASLGVSAGVGYFLAFSTTVGGLIPLPLFGEIAVAEESAKIDGLSDTFKIEGLELKIGSEPVDEVQSPQLYRMEIGIVPGEIPEPLSYATGYLFTDTLIIGCLGGTKAEASRRQRKEFEESKKPKTGKDARFEEEQKKLAQDKALEEKKKAKQAEIEAAQRAEEEEELEALERTLALELRRQAARKKLKDAQDHSEDEEEKKILEEEKKAALAERKAQKRKQLSDAEVDDYVDDAEDKDADFKALSEKANRAKIARDIKITEKEIAKKEQELRGKTGIAADDIKKEIKAKQKTLKGLKGELTEADTLDETSSVRNESVSTTSGREDEDEHDETETGGEDAPPERGNTGVEALLGGKQDRAARRAAARQRRTQQLEAKRRQREKIRRAAEQKILEAREAQAAAEEAALRAREAAEDEAARRAGGAADPAAEAARARLMAELAARPPKPPRRPR
jgi:hypothetical protein